ncbi:MAG: B12-binding domain-containing radical SAM protein [Oligoflexia bacterium]|nr:B12-binding domain-containing radical SAM protein [Oligoflexia bacterium]
MTKNVWLINLFGSPCAPSSFNPDNSLAALAGSLKASSYKPLIIDYQTLSWCQKFIPPTIGEQVQKHVKLLHSNPDDQNALETLQELNQQLEHHQKLIVSQIAEDLIKEIHAKEPLFIGLKLYSGEGIHLTRWLARLLRQQTQVPLVGGGPLVRVIGKELLNHMDEFDYLIDGEAERAIVKFAQFLENGSSRSDVPGLIYKGKAAVEAHPIDAIKNLDELPMPCYDKEVYPACYEANEKALVFQIDESRGCPNACSFCVHPRINGKGVRCRNPELVAEHIAQLKERFGAFAFRFTGSNTPAKFLNAFSKIVLKRNLNIRYSCYASVNMLSLPDLEQYKKSGLCGVFIGVETLDEHILDVIINKRGQGLEKVQAAVSALLQHEIFVTTSYIYPMPGVKIDSTEMLRDFILKNFVTKEKEVGSVMVVPGLVIPGTPWYDQAEKFGFVIKDKRQLISDYVNIVMRLFMPKSLMGDVAFTYNNQSFRELSRESDRFNKELAKSEVLLSITDDWMLMGKLSGRSLKEFKTQSIQSLMSGDYDELERMIKTINHNSREEIFDQLDDNRIVAA